MRVLHVDTGREWRGGQTQLLHLAIHGPECAVALPPDAPLRPALVEAGVAVFPVRFRGALRGTRALGEVVRRFEPDLVAAHTSHAHGHAVRATGRPVVVHRRLDFAPTRLSRRKYHRARRFVAVSEGVRQVLVRYGIGGDRIDVVHDGVARSERLVAPADRIGLRHELSIPRAAPVALAVGALVPHKGHRHAVDALARLPGWHLAIAGVGPLEQTLRSQAGRLGVTERLHLLGQREDMGRLYRSADVVIHPSTEEGMGQAVAEALICGSRVVASDTGGLTEIVRGRGWLSAPGDPGDLARGILEAAAAPEPDPATVRDLFTVQAMVQGTIRAYCAALG